MVITKTMEKLANTEDHKVRLCSNMPLQALRGIVLSKAQRLMSCECRSMRKPLNSPSLRSTFLQDPVDQGLSRKALRVIISCSRDSGKERLRRGGRANQLDGDAQQETLAGANPVRVTRKSQANPRSRT